MNTSSRKHLFKTSSLLIGLLGCCAALLLASCSKKQSEAIIGKWRVDKDQTIVEFRKDGTMSFTEGGQTMTGTYKFSDDSHMKAELTMKLPAEAKEHMPAGTPDSIPITADCVVKVKGDEMDITATMAMAGQPSQTDTSHLRRIK